MNPSTSTFMGTTLSHLRRSTVPSTNSSGKRSLSLGIVDALVIFVEGIVSNQIERNWFRKLFSIPDEKRRFLKRKKISRVQIELWYSHGGWTAWHNPGSLLRYVWYVAVAWLGPENKRLWASSWAICRLSDLKVWRFTDSLLRSLASDILLDVDMSEIHFNVKI